MNKHIRYYSYNNEPAFIAVFCTFVTLTGGISGTAITDRRNTYREYPHKREPEAAPSFYGFMISQFLRNP
ncbi:TPA: hypothetical protein ACJG9G_005737, partial [Salmonella enterica subsp. enterica serovar Java]